MDETGESSAGGQGVYTQNYGKGPDSRGLSGPVLESTGMDGEANMAMGLSTQLVSNEVVMRSGQEQPDSECDLFQEMGGRSSLDFLVGRGSVPGNSVKEYIFPSRAGHAAENVGAWSGMHGVPPFGSRQAQAGVGAAYPGGNIGSTGIDERQVDNIVGSTSSTSLNFVFRDCQNPHNGGRTCRSNGGENATDRHSVRSNNLQSTPEIGTYGFGTPGNSTRSSACKRKSCAPVVACSSSYQSGSLRRGGLQESYDGRAVGVSGMSRCSTAIAGCTSGSGVGASTSSSAEATFMGLGVRPSVVAGTLEDLQSPIVNFGRETESLPETLRDGRAGKSVIGSSIIDSSMDADDTISTTNLLVNQVLSSTAPHHNCSPSLVGGRTGAPAAPRRSETTSSSTGARERPTLRYSSARNLANRASSSQLGAAVAAETSVHNQGINYHSLEPMSLAAPLPSNSVFPVMQTNPAAPSSSSTLRPPSHPPSLRSRLQGSTAHTLLPSMSTPGATSSRLSTPFHPSLLAPSVDSLPSAASLLQGSMLSRLSAPGVRERSFSSVAESLLGMPLRGLHLSAGDGAHQPRLVAEGLAEVSHPNYDILLSQLLMLEATLLFGGMGLHDQHSDLRLDVDNMSYEELLALEERIGNVSTGVTAEVVAQKLRRSQYSSLDVVVARFSEECDIKCSICQEEYVEGDELGKIECGHGYHVSCIQQWLMQKNQCPICKAAAFS
ncbi:unnamed protein product [Sphagnum troendelagicum]|uniref:RING-type E3 ubiquitin transferase n=1 Tax=Sphagnum troendelagicum TaxID=128251 RepID=A0ABP0TBI6_9BRYO